MIAVRKENTLDPRLPARPSSSVVETLAAWTCAMRHAPLPPMVQEKAALCILDFLTCALSSGHLPWSAQAEQLAARLGGQGDCTVIGSRVRASCAEAAFANGVRAHALVQEDMHPGSTCHLGVVVIPAALALAEVHGASGARLLSAIAAGYEVMARAGRALVDRQNARVFRPTGMVGALGAAAAASVILGLDAERTAHALGLAGNQAVGLNEWSHTGTSEVFFHAGWASRNGVVAALLAELGATGAHSIVEGEAGMAAAYGGADRLGAITAGLGEGFEIMNVYFKPAPACAFAQTPSQVALQLAEVQGVGADDIESVRIEVAQTAASYPGCDHAGAVHTNLQAKTSIQFCVAAVLLKGMVSESNFSRLADPAIASLARRALVATSDAFTAAYPRRQGARITVRLKDGSERCHAQADLVPLDADGVKARYQLAATARLGAQAALSIEHALARLADAPDVVSFIRLAGLTSTIQKDQ